MTNPIELPVNPIVLTAVDQAHTETARILSVIWEGSTTAGDTAELWARQGDNQPSEALIWAGRASDTNTYQGVSLGPYGIRAREGFYAKILAAGRLLVYLREQ